MSVSDEMLMAYADGELEAAARAEVEAELAVNPALAAQLARHRALRQRLHETYDGALQEPVPERLLAAARGAIADVVPLQRAAQARRAWGLPQWAAMAASLVLGVVGARLFVTQQAGETFAVNRGELVARGELATALDRQLASNQAAGAPVRIGLSFRAHDGNWCRSFRLRDGAVGGLACRHDAEWRLEVLAATEAAVAADDGVARPAAGELPAPVLDAIGQRIVGEALDAQAESAAQAGGWR